MSSDRLCSKAFSLVSGTDLDILSVTLKLQMLFLTNMTNLLCTNNLGLNNWYQFSQIANYEIETIQSRPITAIFIARIYRCSIEDQRVLSRALPILIDLIQPSSSTELIDSPEMYPNDGYVLLITTLWIDFLGLTIDENLKTNANFYNDFCIKNNIINQVYLMTLSLWPICSDTQLSKYNYTLASEFKDVLYEKNSRYWGKFQVNKNICRSKPGGALLFHGDLDGNTPMFNAQQLQNYFKFEGIQTKLIEMEGLTHVTGYQSFIKKGGFKSATCTGQIVLQFLYQNQLNLNISTIDYTCSSFEENLIGIDWFYSEPIINKQLFQIFDNSTTDYWGINMTIEQLEQTIKPTENHSNRFYIDSILVILAIICTHILTFNK